VPGDWLDLILIALAVAFAVAGYRRGFIVGMLSFIGFLGGAAAGAVLFPVIARLVGAKSGQQALMGIIVVFLAAMTGQLIAYVLGAALRSRLTWRPAALLDAAGGAVVSMLSVLLIAWLVGSAVANVPFPGVARQVDSSLLLKGVDNVMPTAANTIFSDFRRLFANGPYVQVFGALGGEGALTVPPASPSVIDSPGLAKDRNSIVKIWGRSNCGTQLEGSGFVVSPQHVLTNAHVVAGVTTTLVSGPGRHSPLPAFVVRYDPGRDVAVLFVPGLRGLPLHFASARARRQDNAIVVGYPGNRSLNVTAARVGNILGAAIPDIYGKSTAARAIYSVRAVVRPGNSGGPLLAPNGTVYGVIFATAVGVSDVGYALTAGEVGPDVRAGHALTKAVPTGRCA
jgi:S1-C subfamily serine protease